MMGMAGLGLGRGRLLQPHYLEGGLGGKELEGTKQTQ